ncbi:ATP-binding protein [Kitasatospora herbaricolor]|uniref:ATP-binding protein n=1 Tax=Kitasatospora herbaricolor TaxID=68217 RepID=UPI001E3D03B3|nr:ATP-binding protein [Kitasatospora herbaricolor]
MIPALPRQSSKSRGESEAGTPLGDEASAPYRMRISRLTVDKLGIKLYDRVSAVLAEIIANAYDADATEVTVRLPFDTWLAPMAGKPITEPHEITVVDNGHGMTSDEVNSHYLLVGSDRRRRFGKDTSRRRERRVMGRKGIGKLAPFGICRTVEVITAGGEPTEHGYRVSHIKLHLEDMLFDSEKDYIPEVGHRDGTFSPKAGTTIHLSDFNRKLVPKGEELHRQLCARFGIRRDDWDVNVVNTGLSGALPGFTEDSFRLGELKIDLQEDTKVTFDRTLIPHTGADPLPVSGWLAYAKDAYKDEVMAGVRIYVRGKIVATTRDFGATSGYTGEWGVRSYLAGEIHAEWLDEEEDLVRSDRQDIIWSSELGQVLQTWGVGQIKALAKRGRSSVRKRTREVFEQAADLNSRLLADAPGDSRYRDSVKEAFRALVSDSDRESASDPERVERYVELAKTIAPHRDLLDTLRKVSEEVDNPLDVVLALFQKARIAEFYALGQVAQERVDVVNRLRDLIADGNTLERPLQELIEKAPWLLAPEWTPLGMNETLDRVRDSFETWCFTNRGSFVATPSIPNSERRPDFVLLNGARGTLWVVEIKRVNYRLTDEEFSRAVDYLGALEDFLDDTPELGREFPIRRLTFIVDHIDRLSRANRKLLENNEQIERRNWHDLLEQTDRAHRDFLAKVKKIRHQSAGL